jgi:hypothetical protein
MGNKWIIEDKFDFHEFEKCLAENSYIVESSNFASVRRQETYQHLLKLAEMICQRFKRPDADLEPYQLVRACYTVFNPVKEWPSHWNAKPYPWTKNDFLEKQNIVDQSPLTAFSERNGSAFSWFVGVMSSCMKEMDAWHLPEAIEEPLL